MRSGELDRQIVIQKFTTAADGYGEPIKTWTTHVTVMANVKPAAGRERFTTDQVLAEVDTVFRIRYRTGITNKMRISYGGNFYDIRFVQELGRKEGLEILAQAQGVA